MATWVNSFWESSPELVKLALGEYFSSENQLKAPMGRKLFFQIYIVEIYTVDIVEISKIVIRARWLPR